MPSHPEPRRVEAALIDEYVATATCPKAPPQPAAGNLGQLYALFMHKMTEAEVQVGADSVTGSYHRGQRRHALHSVHGGGGRAHGSCGYASWSCPALH